MAKDRKNKKKKKHRVFWFFIKLQIVLMLLVLGALGYFYFGGYASQVRELHASAVSKINHSDESIFMPSQTGTIYDADGNILTELKGEKNSDYVRFEDIPSNFITTMICVEDKKFYSHNGVNLRGILRAAKAMLQNGEATQGGSTITMQLAKLIYMEPSKTWQYKIEQMFLAVELEKKYSKNKIMEFYLNNIYFANNYYGIAAACHGYFDCELKDLSLSQCAFLCAIPNSPSYYDPVTNIAHTLQRRDRILESMRDDGKISLMQYTKAVGESITLKRPKRVNNVMHNYVDTYVNYCATRAMMEKEGFIFRYEFQSEEDEKNYDEEYDQLYADCQKDISTGGYKIYTSIDMALQNKLQNSLDEGLKGFTDKNKEGVYATQGAAVCIDNESGRVAAIVGGRSQDFNAYTLNRAYQSHRQPGSSIKPLIVYTPAFEKGYEPDSKVVDEKIEDGPSNSSGSYIGETTIRRAVAKSINTVAWKLYDEVSPKKGISYLKEMDFSRLDQKDVTLATSLGGFTNGVSPMEMASAYAALEHDGIFRSPTCIDRIVDTNENIVYESDAVGKQVYKQDAARMMTDVMTSVMEEGGTGRKLKLSDMPCAGKTGTTNSRKDGWFVGYTRYYTTSVWVGNDIPSEIEDLSGGSYPGRIWNSFMEEANKDLAELEFLPYAQMSDDYQNEQEIERDIQDKIHQERENRANERAVPSDNEDNADDGSDRQNNDADDRQQGQGDRQEEERENKQQKTKKQDREADQEEADQEEADQKKQKKEDEETSGDKEEKKTKKNQDIELTVDEDEGHRDKSDGDEDEAQDYVEDADDE